MSSSSLQLKKVINASGRMTILGVSTLSERVLEEMAFGAQNYFEMDDLVNKAGKKVAEIIGTEDALITNSASASIALAIAGVIGKDNVSLVDHLHDGSIDCDREVLVMKGHNVNYGAPIEVMIRLGGGEVKEVGYANECTVSQMEAAISEKTAAVIYVKSHHCVQKNMASLFEVSELCKNKKIPLLLDAAAEEDIDAYGEVADLIILSGTKAIGGPTSGILAGKGNFITYSKLHLKGIGRAMKVGKEQIFGLLQALEDYSHSGKTKEEQRDMIMPLMELDQLPGVRVTIVADEAGREICRARVQIDDSLTNCHALDVVRQLKEGEDIAIYTRDYHANLGSFDIDPRPLLDGDINTITESVKNIVSGEA
ncbi:DgaE family pyridoxal phosphate-dependent ammonia lyase [Bacillus cellulosilyticus]|uniref:Pyridoxal phosphate-dependent enzyme n=1 Tax=Evansella cellulosilytica (strain ATCC 21833 / DSM 2522 / FERM P-1141 / JCM 9156 / N-4) TaxID=649639 RepID=E6TT32_EVAC2|nr:pyridoxal phosphate-dependent enzyme [Evansella cellulosilytica DSM 2522]